MKNLYIKKVFIFSILALSIFPYGIAEASIVKTLVKGVALGTGVGVGMAIVNNLSKSDNSTQNKSNELRDVTKVICYCKHGLVDIKKSKSGDFVTIECVVNNRPPINVLLLTGVVYVIETHRYDGSICTIQNI
jgi:hypothetical protein